MVTICSACPRSASGGGVPGDPGMGRWGRAWVPGPIQSYPVSIVPGLIEICLGRDILSLSNHVPCLSNHAPCRYNHIPCLYRIQCLSTHISCLSNHMPCRSNRFPCLFISCVYLIAPRVYQTISRVYIFISRVYLITSRIYVITCLVSSRHQPRHGGGTRDVSVSRAQGCSYSGIRSASSARIAHGQSYRGRR